VIPLKINAPLIFGFIALFGLLVGPVNLFVFARGVNRPRLFWTTPLISLAGTALLVAAMVLQDGFGGEGARLSLTMVLPEQKQMITHQEQRAKTGVLLSSGFDLPAQEPVWLTPLDSDDGRKKPSPSAHSYLISGNQAAGSWFRSRAVQSLAASRTSSSRGSMELESKDGALTAMHSLPTAMKDVWLHDAKGRYWYAPKMGVGQRITFTEKKKEDFTAAFEKDTKPLIRQAFANELRLLVSSANDAWFLAESEQPADLAIPRSKASAGPTTRPSSPGAFVPDLRSQISNLRSQIAKPMPLLELRSVSRHFPNVQAVNDISFTIDSGQVVGFIGANGAGKTTTMRMMATLDVPTSGSISIGGYDVVQHPEQVRRLVGWMPDAFGTYPHMTVFEYLDFFARAYGLTGARRRERVAEVMDFADLTPLADRMMNALSKGMGQRLCFGRMLLPDPEFLIMDEPAAGLDPKARIEFKNLVRLLAQRGKTVFISSHILSELGEMCDTLLFIDAGKLVYQGSADDLKRGEGGLAASAGTRTVVNVVLHGPPQPLLDWAEMQSTWRVVDTHREGARLELASADPLLITEGLKQMMSAGLPIIDFHREERRLEEAFVDMLRRKE
jgi:ABC-2 type transport system ATP-binding protein